MANSSRKIVLTGEDFKRGMNSDTFALDGFFDNVESYGIDITSVPGVLYPQQAPDYDVTQASSGDLIAWCKGGGPFGASPNTLVVSATGKMYLAGSANLSSNYQDTINTYNKYFTDAVFYKGSFYVTSQQNIAKLDTSDGTTITSASPSWWTGLGYSSLDLHTPHPMVIFEDSLWIADGYRLHKFDGTTVTYNAFMLTSDQQITALFVDPGSGRLMIATTQGVNGSGSLPRVAKINFWDGYSNKVLRSVVVDAMVSAIISNGGTIYMFSNYSMGYWNGSGISWLRTFYGNKRGGNLLTKHQMAVHGNVLYVIDGTSVLSYQAPIGTLEKRWIKVWRNFTSLDVDIAYGQINIIANIDTNSFLVAYTAGGVNSGYKAYIHNFGKVTKGNTGSNYPIMAIKSSYFNAGNAVTIKKIKMFFSDQVESGISPYGLAVQSPDYNRYIYFTPATNNLTGKTVTSLEYLPRINSVSWLEDFRLYIYNGLNSNASYGIRKIIIYLDDVMDTN